MLDLLRSPTFCMIPWVHLHVWPEGNSYPCCFFDAEQPIGSMREQTLEQLWNSPRMRELRRSMLAEQPTDGCRRCYELERAGSPSLRKGTNRAFAHHFGKVRATLPDGTVEKLHLPYVDIRFSNLCNFRCRTCGPGLSSSWYEEAGDPNQPRLLHPTARPEDLWAQLEPLLPHVEEIYFAGGEPLLIEEHYRLLERLIALGRTQVRIRYNTNFSQMEFQGADVRRLWSAFDNVSVGASLDAMGARAEYLRKGTSWEQIERNRREMRDLCPRVHFYISATLSAINALHFPSFHRAWIEADLVSVEDLYLNLLTSPSHYRLQILPPEMKRDLHESYDAHIRWLEARGARAVIDSFRSLLRFMDSCSLQSELPAFRAITQRLDQLRGERLDEVFPELAPLTHVT
jgi:radical SAM protein with 4Fe4S-binding SPASM domain